MEIGTKVVFTKAHHSMNPRLKALVGREGIVGLIGEGANKKVLVSFDTFDNSWWINPRLLTPRAADDEPRVPVSPDPSELTSPFTSDNE